MEFEIACSNKQFVEIFQLRNDQRTAMLFDDTKERQNESQIIRFFEQEKEKING